MNRAQRRASSIRPIRNAFCGIRGCYGAYVPSLGFANKSHTGNESVPKIIINDTISLFFRPAINILVISNHNIFRVLFDKIYIYILSLEMTSPGNQHCASCIGTLSYHIVLQTSSAYSQLLSIGSCHFRHIDIS